ncbi:MAG: hypothetical protein ABGW87_03445 [Sphingomonadaceae bacterium]
MASKRRFFGLFVFSIVAGRSTGDGVNTSLLAWLEIANADLAQMPPVVSRTIEAKSSPKRMR